MSESDNELIGQCIANNKYRLTQFLGSGSFSTIYKVEELNGKELVVKLESMDTTTPQLGYEFGIYQILRQECNHWSIPKTYFFGSFGTYRALVLDLLGPNLTIKFKECGHRFSVKTATLLALQMIDIMQYIHSRGVIFRDVKPENFLLGLTQTPNQNKLHIIDFGLAKEYRNKSGKHIKYREGVVICGTGRYISINTHLHREQSRRDDMESIGHLLIYFLRGDLPWSGLKMKDFDKKLEKVGKMKQKTKLEILCKDNPKEFCDYLKTCRSLDFNEEPNYAKMKEMFESLLSNREEEMDYIYDWSLKPIQSEETKE